MFIVKLLARKETGILGIIGGQNFTFWKRTKTSLKLEVYRLNGPILLNKTHTGVFGGNSKIHIWDFSLFGVWNGKLDMLSNKEKTSRLNTVSKNKHSVWYSRPEILSI